MKMEAASSETVDAKVLALAREDAIWLSVKDYFPDDAEGPGAGRQLRRVPGRRRAWLGDEALSSRRDARERGQGCRPTWIHRGAGRGSRARDLEHAQEIRRAPGNMQGEKRPIPFVEDTVVPPESLADYIASSVPRSIAAASSTACSDT
jgi:FAD/FMN-containing dehydrogenase